MPTAILDERLVAAGVDARCDLVPCKEDDEAAWLAARPFGLGASEAAAALGLSPYLSPVELHLLKTGQITPDVIGTDEQADAAWWGIQLEDDVAHWYGIRTGRELFHPRFMFVLRSNPVLRVTPDRIDVDEHGDLGLVECKTADARLWKDWQDDGAPPWYQVQVALQCHVLGIYRGRLACLIGGNRPVIREVDLDPQLCELVAERVLNWWTDHVINGAMPPVDASASCKDALGKLWRENGNTIALDADAAAALAGYHDAHRNMKHWEQLKDEYANQIRAFMGPNAIGTWRNVPVVTWRETTPKFFDAKAHEQAHAACHQEFTGNRIQRTLRASSAAKALKALEGATP